MAAASKAKKKPKSAAAATAKKKTPTRKAAPKKVTAAKKAPAKKAPAKKAPAKKAPAKKAPAKKAPAKKAPAQKAAAKKAVVRKTPARPKVAARKVTRPPAPPEPVRSSGIPARKPGTPGFGISPTYLSALPEYEKGMALLQERKFAEAEAQFERMIRDYPTVKDLVDRARTYISLCQKQRDTGPRLEEFDDFYYHGVYLSNRGDYAEALEHLKKALALRPDSPKVHYSIASVLCLQGEREPALESLRRAVALDESIRFYVKNDPDFQQLHGDSEFHQLVGVAEAQSAG